MNDANVSCMRHNAVGVLFVMKAISFWRSVLDDAIGQYKIVMVNKHGRGMYRRGRFLGMNFLRTLDAVTGTATQGV